MLSKSELKDYYIQTQEYYDAIEKTGYAFDPLYREKLHRQLSLKSAVSRLEALQAQIQWEIEKLYAEQHTLMEQGLSETYEESYYRTIYNIQQGVGFGSPFSTLNISTIEKAVSQKWLGDNYSDRIWANKDRLTLALEQTIPQGFILGHNPRKIAKSILNLNPDEEGTTPLKTARYRAERLARTEFNNIANQASIAGYEAAGIELYQILATLDKRTSEICGDMDGKKFEVGKEETAVNFPPFHPNCRTTTIPYFEPDEIDAMFEKATRIARDPTTGKNYYVPADMTYKQWKESLPQETLENMELTQKMIKNMSSDKEQFTSYKHFISNAKKEYGKETVSDLFTGFPTKFAEFQEKKYTDTDWWKTVKENRAMLKKN